MKIYLKPTTDDIYVNVEQLLTNTSGPVGPGTGDNKDLSTAPTTDEQSGNLSRRKDIWAGDEEEEEQF